ncbi:MAG TPA: DNA polymerase III subunit alpha [Solirubrobacteraceae bacterium]|jgi:error-prone DNA polymerase|nr:DNA polymerase III subunit alpha [Solirubrobacteraceae bacterium]
MAQTPPYVELHCHSAYSFLDGVSLPDELAYRAAALGHGALALTDHNSVSGSMELAQIAKDAMVRTIHGAEVDLSDGRHLTLLVEDARGWRNLCRILTRAHAHTRDGQALGEPAIELPALLEHAQGLVCLTGCAERGVRDEPTVRRLLDAFGPERLRVELQRPYARHDRARNRALEGLARRVGIRCVATGDVHAHAACRAELQDAFVALRHRTTLDASEPLRRGNRSHVLSAPRAMAARFADHPHAVRETLVLAERLRFELTRDLGYSYPGAEDADAWRRLAELCRSRLDERYGSHAERPGAAEGRRCARAALAQAEARLAEELAVIARLGLAGFFLLHHEMLELAREVACRVRDRDSARTLLAPGRGRGSSVSSIVCYLTGLSHIDPIANDLLLGRFLHEDLRGLPDIDLDFPREIREALIPRVHERFGGERAALVAAFPTFRARGAIRELGKALGLPPAELERAARTADGWERPGEHDLPEGSPRWRWLVRLVAQAYGLPRHLSQHPGGMIVSTRPLIDCCPTVPSAMAGRQMVQWDKDSCADAGFLKIDLLGLGMLSAVERCVDEIERVRGERIDLSRIPFDDAETFAAIQRADTVGVFQIESRAQMQSLKRTRPRNLKDLTVQVAIVRPGPIQGGAVNPYVQRRARVLAEGVGGIQYEPPYEHPALREVLAETLGTVIFQDQVMQVSEAFAGFTPGEADGLRRAMSRKRSQEAMASHRERFLAGAARHSGAEPQTAQRVWEMVSGFAGFGFPKAHATAFGLLAYQSTWLRVHYGPEFLCALLNEQPMGFYAPDSLVHEAQRRGIPVLGLDVNASGVQCSVELFHEDARRGSVSPSEGGVRAAEGGVRAAEGGVRVAKGGVHTPGGSVGAQNATLGVRLGLGYVKGAAVQEVRALVTERERAGAFRDVADLAARTATSRPTLERLAWSGACDAIAGSRREALWQLGMAAPAADLEDGVQMALPIELPATPRLRALDRWQRLLADYATSGVTASDHAMAILRPRLSAPLPSTSAQLARMPDGCSVTVAGLVIARQRPGTAKGTMFLLFEDEWGAINLIVPKGIYESRRALARAEPLLLARGRLERREGVTNVLVRELEPLERHVVAEQDGERQTASVGRLPRRDPGGVGKDGQPASADEEHEAEASEGARMAANMRAVAPPVQSFASGRRR